MHFHPTDDVFLVGAFVFILGIVVAVAAFLEKRKAKAPSFPNYFYSEFERSLLHDRTFKEDEDSLADHPSRS